MIAMRFFFHRGQFCPGKSTKHPHEVNTTFKGKDYDDSICGDTDASSDAPDVVHYQTHAFQQRCGTDHPATEGVKDAPGFATFMQAAVHHSFPPQVVAPVSRWWSFDRDYDDENVEQGEDEEIEFLEVKKSDDEDDSPLLMVQEESDAHREDLLDDDGIDRTAGPLDKVPHFYKIDDTHLLTQNNIILSNLSTYCTQFDSTLPRLINNTQSNNKIPGFIEESEVWFSDSSISSNEHVGFHHIQAQDTTCIFDEEFAYNDFVQDAPIRPLPSQEKTKVEKCFEHIKFVTPQDLDAMNILTHDVPIQNKTDTKYSTSSREIVSPEPCNKLSQLITPMDPKLFVETPDECRKWNKLCSNSRSSQESSYESSMTAATHASDPVFHLDQYSIDSVEKTNRFDNIRKKLCSSFRSKSHRRVAFGLGQGTMPKKDMLYAKSLLPVRPLESDGLRRNKTDSSSTSRIPRGLPSIVNDRPVSVLLVNPELKIFEIVLVDVLPDTTVGDTLSKARAYATDSVLSEQKYISLCNRKLELAAPMLPVSLLVKRRRSRNHKKLRGKSYPLALQDSCARGIVVESETDKRRDMENRLLVAVPEGYTASECQNVRRMLWRNPKVQRWWQQEDPFCHPDAAPMGGKITKALPPKQRSRREKDKKLKYQKLESME